MNALSELLNLPDSEKVARGLAHTPAEINQQPEAWLSTYEVFQKNRAAIAAFLALAGIGPGSASAPTVFLIGAGTSDYIGQCLTFLLRKRWGCEVVAVASTDLLTHTDDWMIPGGKYFWISFSRSGDSPEGVAVLERARKSLPDIYHLVISCNANGRMIRENVSDRRILSICLDDAVNDRGLAMTSSFSNMVVFGQCLAHFDDPGSYRQILSEMVEAGKNFLPLAADCASEIAKDAYTRACFVGSGPLRAMAKESALKLLELTAGKVLTMSESALGMRHGPIAALDQDTLFVCFLSNDPRVRQYECDVLDQIGRKRLAKTRIVVSGDATSSVTAAGDFCLTLSGLAAISDNYRPPLDVIFGQLLGLFFSLRSNLRPDCPSPNGAISRVVQNFSIHQ